MMWSWFHPPARSCRIEAELAIAGDQGEQVVSVFRWEPGQAVIDQPFDLWHIGDGQDLPQEVTGLGWGDSSQCPEQMGQLPCGFGLRIADKGADQAEQGGKVLKLRIAQPFGQPQETYRDLLRIVGAEEGFKIIFPDCREVLFAVGVCHWRRALAISSGPDWV